MNGLRFSAHAERRLQQRGMPPIVVELLDRFGASERCAGGEKISFDKRSRQALRRHFGGERSLRVLKPWLNTYTVVSDDGKIVTAGHCQKRINRE